MKYSIKKPGTKNILMILIAIILVGGAFAFAEYRNREAQIVYMKNQVLSTETIVSTTSVNNIDNTDWKKILMANDLSASSTVDLTKNDEKLEPIDIVSRQFFAQYLELHQIGAAKDEQSQQDLIEKTINSMSFAVPKSYKISQIKINSNNSVESVKQYGNNVGDIFKRYQTNSRNEGVIVRDYQLTEDPSILKELDPIASSYKNIINSLLKLSVPENLSPIHLDLINAINEGLFIVESFKKSEIDPVSGLQAVSMYQVAAKNLYNAVSGIRKYLISLDISYIPTEGGYMFTK